MPSDVRFEPIRIAELNETRQMHALRDLADESVEIADGVVTFSKGVDWINRTTRIGLNTDVSAEDFGRVEAFLQERGATPKFEFTTIATEQFIAGLAERGYVNEQFENVLIRGMRAGEDPFELLTHKTIPGLEIEYTDPSDSGACREHARLVLSGFMPEPFPEEHIDMAVRSIVHPRSAGFVAKVDGVPAGACGMEIFEHKGQRLASLWGASVAEPFRRRGVQQAMLAHRMAYGLERGCEYSLIESKPGIATERNAVRMGFTLGYVRICVTKRDLQQTARHAEPPAQ